MAAGGRETGQRPKHVDRVVAQLQPLVQVEKNQIEKYVGLRSDKSVEKLEQLLGDYKSVSGQQSKGPTVLPGVRPSTVGVPSGSGRSAQRSSRGSKNTEWQALWSARFGGANQKAYDAEGANARQKVLRSSAAFNKVWNPARQEELTQWRSTTKEENVQQLAEICRGISSAADQNISQYKHKMKPLPTEAYCSPRMTSGAIDRNLSRVPIGSIYRTDPWELEASAKRHEEEEERLKRCREGQEQMLRHKEHPKKMEHLAWVDKKSAERSRGSIDVGGCLGVWPSSLNQIGSEYRTQFQSKV